MAKSGVVATFSGKKQNLLNGSALQGSGTRTPIQGSGIPVQGSAPNIQGSSPALQVSANPINYLNLVDGSGDGGASLGATDSGSYYGGGSSYGSGGSSYSQAAVDPNAARRASLKEGIKGKRALIEAAYNDLFANLDNLLRAKSADLDTQYAGQIDTAGKNLADALPTIDSSYASLGSYDSTQRGDARGKAKDSYNDTVKTIGNNKAKDVAALGQYGNESKARFQADKDSANRYIDSADTTTDVDSLQTASNSIDSNLSQTGVTKATLGTDASVSRDIKNLTADGGRFQAAIDSLKSVLDSSLPGAVKQAAVTAVTNNSGLTEDEKKKVQAQYGNVYAEQNAA